MKKRIIPLILALSTLCAASQSPVSPDARLRSGVLPNGLTYYILPNGFPEGSADFFLAQRVGSVQELESQRGLAHFLEHMCFNGTEHFPGNSLITYLESIGVKFGANLNAYTSTDETVYNISSVPVVRSTIVDSCLLVLRDWCCGLRLDGKEIDKERGVIEGEWRRKAGANTRLMDKTMPLMYPNCAYGERMPIGLMSVVKGFKHKELRNYYKKWYNPMNQAVIVVGSIDTDEVEKKVVSLFSGITPEKGATKATPVPVPPHASPIAAVASDPEQNTTLVRVFIKHPSLEAELNGTTAYFEQELMRSLVVKMLKNRFNELSLSSDAPFTRVLVGDRKYLLSRTQQALQFTITAKNGMAAQSVEAVTRELRRVSLFGFTQSELKVARLEFLSAVEKMRREKEKYSNSQLARDLVRVFLDGEPMPSIDDYCRIMSDLAAAATTEQTDDFFASICPMGNPGNVAIQCYAPAGDATLPSSEQLLEAFATRHDAELEPYPERDLNSTLLLSAPTPGSIVGESDDALYGAKQWTLSNGMRVYYLYRDSHRGEVVVAGAGPGGLSQNYTPENAASLKAFGGVMSSSGFGHLSSSDLKTALAGKDVKMRTFVSKTEEGFQGAAARQDLETAFQLLYLKLTNPQNDEAAFQNFLETNRQRVANQSDPKYEFADSIFANVYGHHPLAAEKLSKEEIEQVRLDTVLNVYRDRFADMSDISVYVVGDFSVDSLRLFTERYIASLPCHGRVERPRDIGYHVFGHDISREWTRAMSTPQDKVYYFWSAPCPVSLRNTILARLVGQIFSGVCREEIREARAWTYHVDTHCSVASDINGSDPSVTFLPLNVTVTAGKGSETKQLIEGFMADMAAGKTTQEQLEKAKAYLRKVHHEGLEDNTYWMSMLRQYDKHHIDFHTDYLSTLDGITLVDIQTFVREHILSGSRLTLKMTPE